MIARIGLSFAIVAALTGPAQAQTSKLMGQVSYPDQMPLGKTAVLEVTLEDVSDPASNRIVIATTHVPKPGHTPVIFSIEYDAALVKPAGRYAVRAHIADAGTKVFETATPVRVLTQGTGTVANITLVPVESAVRRRNQRQNRRPHPRRNPRPNLKSLPCRNPNRSQSRRPGPSPRRS